MEVRIESAGKKIVASPGERAVITIYKVPSGYKAKVRSCTIGFPVGVNFELEIRAMFGNISIVPTQGTISGDSMVIPIDVDFVLNSDEEFKIEYRNLSSTDIRSAFVLAIFEVFK
ncbi:MAG: hypothetical protein ACPLX8_01170 [Nanopusillaceae archaeon]